MSKTSKVLVMCLSDPSGNPRPRRVISICKEMGLSVDVASHPLKNALDFDNYFLIKQLSRRFIKLLFYYFCKLNIWVFPVFFIKNLANNYCAGVSQLVKKITYNTYDLLIVEDLQLLPLAFKMKGNASIIFDAREYYPRQKEDSLIFRLFEKPERIRLCKAYLHLCDRVLTVSPGLAEEYKREFNITTELIRSVPLYFDCHPATVKTERIRMVHHGGAKRNRKLESMIKVFLLLDDRFTLDFYLVSNNKYVDELKSLAASNTNIKFKDSVSFDEIIPMLNSYDIGLFYVEPTTFNLKHCLPNKLFEFIQARLMVAIGPSPDMAALVLEYQCGIVSDSFNIEKMAQILNELTTEKIIKYKNNSDIAAKALCFEQEGKKLQEIISRFC